MENSSKVYIQEWRKSARSTESSRVNAKELDWYRNNVKPVRQAAAGSEKRARLNATPTSQLDRVAGEPLTTNFFCKSVGKAKIPYERKQMCGWSPKTKLFTSEHYGQIWESYLPLK